MNYAEDVSGFGGAAEDHEFLFSYPSFPHVFLLLVLCHLCVLDF